MADLAKPTGVQPAQAENYAPSRAQSENKVEDTRVDTPSEVTKKTEEFEKMLNDQQKITEVAAKERGDSFDPAEDIAENAIFGQSGLATSL